MPREQQPEVEALRGCPIAELLENVGGYFLADRRFGAYRLQYPVRRPLLNPLRGQGICQRTGHDVQRPQRPASSCVLRFPGPDKRRAQPGAEALRHPGKIPGQFGNQLAERGDMLRRQRGVRLILDHRDAVAQRDVRQRLAPT